MFRTITHAELRRIERDTQPFVITRIISVARAFATMIAIVVIIDGIVAALYGVDLAETPPALPFIFLWILPLFVLTPVGLLLYARLLFQIFVFCSGAPSALIALTPVNARQLMRMRLWAIFYYRWRDLMTLILFYFSVVVWVSLVAYRLQLYYDLTAVQVVFGLEPFYGTAHHLSTMIFCLMGCTFFTLLDIMIAAVVSISVSFLNVPVRLVFAVGLYTVIHMTAGYWVADGSAFRAEIAGYVSGQWVYTMPLLHNITVIFSAGSRLLLDTLLHYRFQEAAFMQTFTALATQMMFSIVTLTLCWQVSQRLAYRTGYLSHVETEHSTTP